MVDSLAQHGSETAHTEEPEPEREEEPETADVD
jgi:hypothetical protein